MLASKHIIKQQINLPDLSNVYLWSAATGTLSMLSPFPSPKNKKAAINCESSYAVMFLVTSTKSTCRNKNNTTDEV